MMKRIILLSWLLVILIQTDLFPQSKAEIKNSFYDAESWILFEAYKDALPLYLQLNRRYPDNANFKYRIGQCYINTPGSKDRAIKYLEEAVNNINPRYREGRFRESGAPYDALYYLANAYRINNQLNKAIETYNQFKKNLDPEVYDTTIVDLQIQSCLNAKELLAMPKYIRRQNIGNVINESNSEYDPVISDDETMLVFEKSEAFYDAIMYSLKVNGKWTAPVNMNEILKVDRDLFPTSLSADGKTLYLYSSADYDGIIYSSNFENNTWSPMIKLNENINTKFWESHATVSHDNKKLYFTSNRKGTYGGLDIYVSVKDSDGNWGPAENLGPVINSAFNEESPFLSKDDKTLFFSSRGHLNIGGYDIFSSTLQDNGEWSVPKNAGYPLNTTDDDIFFKPLNEGYEGYYSLESPEGFGRQDIYRIEIFTDEHPRKFIVKGIANVADLLRIYDDSVKVSVLNVKNPGNTEVHYTNPKTWEYEFIIPQGDYRINYEGYGGEKVTKEVNLPLAYPSDSFLIPGIVLPRTDFAADLSVIGDKNITVSKGDSLLLPLKVEPQSSLTVENWTGNTLVSSKKYPVKNPSFRYKMVPQRGDNKVVFKLSDRFNNSSTAEVFITRKGELPEKQVVRPEYSKIIAKKQVDAYLSMLRNRADEKLLKIINDSDIEKQEFGKTDDLISYLKVQASGKNMNAEDVDKLALKVAEMDNVLTQSAVDLLAKYSNGELKNILAGLDINETKLKSWIDLQKYISEKSEGRITSEILADLAADILTEPDPSIPVIREKILAFSENSENGAALRQSVNTTDLEKIKLRGKWLKAFCDEALKLGQTPDKIAELFAIISTLPDTKIEQFRSDLTENSDDLLSSSLKSLDLSTEKINSAEELVLFLITSKDKNKFPEDSVFKSIANLIVSKNIAVDSIKSRPAVSQGCWSWILLIIIGAAAIVFFILFRRNKKRKKQ